MSINLCGTYCIFGAEENKYDCNIIIRSNSFAVDAYYVFMKNLIKEKEICYSLLPQNIKLKFVLKYKSFFKLKKNESTIKEM